MRYYYYGNEASAGGEGAETESLEKRRVYTGRRKYKNPDVIRGSYQRDSNLIIEEDTVYEIDEACMNCRKKSV